MESREWPIDIGQEHFVEEVLEHSPECCIYRVPQFLRGINEKAYTPRLISIGPLHYGRKELMGMERQKKRFLYAFREREEGEQKLEKFQTFIKNQEQCIRMHYSVSSHLRSSEYVEMILRDAVFIVELFQRNFSMVDDSLLNPPLAFYIMADLLLLENQLPYFVLDHLYALSSQGRNHQFYQLCFKFISTISIFQYMSKHDEQTPVKHLTDFLRHVLVIPSTNDSQGQINFTNVHGLPSATKLNNSGLKFRGIQGKSLLDISLEKKRYGKWLPWFEVNELQMPRIQIFDETEFTFRNLMALEMFHYPFETHICDYVVVMNFLINTTNDVDLLVENYIIVNCLGDNEAIVKMFKRLCSNITISNSRYYVLVEKMKLHYSYRWNYLKAATRTWIGTATVGATFLLILTVIQTVCSIMQL